jgi:hypothetical protein
MLSTKIAAALEVAAADGTQDGIRAFFSERNVKGEPCEVDHCVIAEYLRSEDIEDARVFPSERSGHVTYLEWDTELADWKWRQVPLPAALNRFALAFDDYEYPELLFAQGDERRLVSF